ncbi:hypothetical protein ACJX0J_033358 [Zea mays]
MPSNLPRLDEDTGDDDKMFSEKSQKNDSQVSRSTGKNSAMFLGLNKTLLPLVLLLFLFIAFICHEYYFPCFHMWHGLALIFLGDLCSFPFCLFFGDLPGDMPWNTEGRWQAAVERT